MKKSKKFIALFMMTIMLISSLAACGKKGKDEATDSQNNSEQTDNQGQNNQEDNKGETKVEDVTLKVWGPQEEQDLLKQMTDAFAKAHRNITSHLNSVLYQKRKQLQR